MSAILRFGPRCSFAGGDIYFRMITDWGAKASPPASVAARDWAGRRRREGGEKRFSAQLGLQGGQQHLVVDGLLEDSRQAQLPRVDVVAHRVPHRGQQEDRGREAGLLELGGHLRAGG